MKNWSILLLVVALNACKFNESVDPTQPLPVQNATVLGFPDSTSLVQDTLFGVYAMLVPQHWMVRDKGIMPAAGVDAYASIYTQQDSSAFISITWENQKRKGGAVKINDVTETVNNFKNLITEYRGATIVQEDSFQRNNINFHHLEAILNWEGYQRYCTWICAAHNGKTFLIDAKYPMHDRESGSALMMRMRKSMVLYNP